jgi:hypothetical protein
MENSANTENWIMQDSGSREWEEGKGAAPSKRPAPQWCPSGITKTKWYSQDTETQVTKDVTKRVGREKRRGRAGLLV